jgi:hypothetical protein
MIVSLVILGKKNAYMRLVWFEDYMVSRKDGPAIVYWDGSSQSYCKGVPFSWEGKL